MLYNVQSSSPICYITFLLARSVGTSKLLQLYGYTRRKLIIRILQYLNKTDLLVHFIRLQREHFLVQLEFFFMVFGDSRCEYKTFRNLQTSSDWIQEKTKIQRIRLKFCFGDNLTFNHLMCLINFFWAIYLELSSKIFQ